jgi:3-methyladenine DNA glycosylase Mpg
MMLSHGLHVCLQFKLGCMRCDLPASVLVWEIELLPKL